MKDDSFLIEEAKKKVNLLSYIESMTNSKIKKVGSTFFVEPCPLCGRKEHFSVHPNDNYFNSFGCDVGGTIIDFMIHYENLTKQEAIKKLLSLADMSEEVSYEYDSSKVREVKSIQNNQVKVETNVTEKPVFNDLIEKVHQSVNTTNYFLNRGLSKGLIKKYKLGYSEEGMNFAIKNNDSINEEPSGFMKMFKYYLPIWDEHGNCTSFITRVDDDSVPDDYDLKIKTHNLKGYKIQLFNERYLKQSGKDIIFVVEGIFDALSIEEFGYPSIALNSVSNKNHFCNLLEQNKKLNTNKTFVLIADNDKAGKELQQTLTEKMNHSGFKIKTHEIKPSNVKDVNEYLVQDRDGLKDFLKKIVYESIS